jgi:hypothetical protein
MRKNSLLTMAALIGLCLASLAQGSAREKVLDDYRHGLGKGWQEKSFAGHTRYVVEEGPDGRHIKATSNAAASALYYRIEYEPGQWPLLRWSWKIEKTLARGDARRKDGDDYAARVYVVFPSVLFWQTRALNYIWANRLPKGEALANAFTANTVMIAVQSGDELAGRWRTEERNIVADFRRHFGSEPPKVGAIAIMTDTDNTGESAVAWYGPIFLARP